MKGKSRALGGRREDCQHLPHWLELLPTQNDHSPGSGMVKVSSEVQQLMMMQMAVVETVV